MCNDVRIADAASEDNSENTQRLDAVYWDAHGHRGSSFYRRHAVLYNVQSDPNVHVHSPGV